MISRCQLWGWGAHHLLFLAALWNLRALSSYHMSPQYSPSLWGSGWSSEMRHRPYQSSPELPFRHEVIRHHLGEGWAAFSRPPGFHHLPGFCCHPEIHNAANWDQRTSLRGSHLASPDSTAWPPSQSPALTITHILPVARDPLAEGGTPWRCHY